MPDTRKPDVPASVLLAFAPLHRVALGVACGTVLGVLIFLMTAYLLLKGGPVVGRNLRLLGQFFFAYSVSWPGAVVGMVWGFVAGFVFGWSFAVARNFVMWTWLTVARSRAEMEHYGDLLDHL